MIVLKFGGTSVRNADAIRKVKEIILAEKDKLIIVVSAVAGVTDLLNDIYSDLINSKFKEAKLKSAELKFIHLNLADELEVVCDDVIECYYMSLINIIDSVVCLGEPSLREKDLILSHGELISSFVIYSFLKKFIPNIELINPKDIIKTDSCFSNAKIDDFSTNIAIKSKLLTILETTDHAITGGFVGSNSNGCATTLGRGGSDFTASVIGKYAHSDLIEIWTDVDGIMTADPSIVENAKIINTLDYQEALDISISGGKVLHYKTIFPAMESNIPIRIRNTFNPESEGTLIQEQYEKINSIKSILAEKGFMFFNVNIRSFHNPLEVKFILDDIFKKYHIETLYAQNSCSEINLICKDNDFLNSLKYDFEFIGDVKVIQNQAVISIIGNDLLRNQHIFDILFSKKERNYQNFKKILVSDKNIKIVLNENDFKFTLNILHKHIFNFNSNHKQIVNNG